MPNLVSRWRRKQYKSSTPEIHMIEAVKQPIVLLGNVGRLISIGGENARYLSSPFGNVLWRVFFTSTPIVTLRWWDPMVAIAKWIRPQRVAIFVADGHFSLLNLNKQVNKRQSKNIFESGYCDIYLIPDRVSLNASEQYPGYKRLYRPSYWERPGISFNDTSPHAHDLVLVYGNDPFFGQAGCSDLIKLVSGIVRKYSDQYTICHILPKNRNGALLKNKLPSNAKIYYGLDDVHLKLSGNSIYLCTPSTLIWQLLAVRGKVAVLGFYHDDACFDPMLMSITEVEAVEEVIRKAPDYWESLRQRFSDMLGEYALVDALLRTLNQDDSRRHVRGASQMGIISYTFRDYLSSLLALIRK